jgi:hypothetical protein
MDTGNTTSSKLALLVRSSRTKAAAIKPEPVNLALIRACLILAGWNALPKRTSISIGTDHRRKRNGAPVHIITGDG